LAVRILSTPSLKLTGSTVTARASPQSRTKAILAASKIRAAWRRPESGDPGLSTRVRMMRRMGSKGMESF
jgi:hypothetical protein